MRLLYLISACAAAYATSSQPAIRSLQVQIPMRDGVRLAANVFLPNHPGRFPVILERTPYGKPSVITANHQALVNHGYAVVSQDVRGRYGSEGIFDPLHQEAADGEDTLNWIARQSWSNGRIGMTGGSYLGIVQWKAALSGNPHLRAIFPVVSGYDDYRDRFYSTGGAMKIGHRLLWMSENMKAPGYQPNFARYVLHLPLRTADIAATGWSTRMYRDAAAHPGFDAFWKAISVKEQLAKIKVPVFAVGGWYDNFVQSDLEAYAALHKLTDLNRVLVGPWPHNMSYQFTSADFGPESRVPVRGLQIQWFDQWLMNRDTPLAEKPPIKLFVMGSNHWVEEREWPPEEARPVKFYLESEGGANTLDGDGTLSERMPRHSAEDHYVFDPHDPVPTRGGAVCCNPKIFPWGPMDQRPVEKRRDVLVYTTRPLREDVEVIGPVEAVLYIATSARDTDFTAKLVDVSPDGYARNLTDGILRLRYRNSLERPELVKQGEIYRITVDAGVTGNAFLKGHRIRLEISSSNFPRFDRNANTGGPVTTETRLFKAAQTVYHSREHPSHLVLMVMPERK